MKKHLFILSWRVEGRTAKRYFDCYLACEWPFGPEATWEDVKAMAVMADNEGYPKEVKQFCAAVTPMRLRSRYAGNGATGPYVINDEEGLTEEQLLERIENMTDKEVGQLLFR